MISVIAWLNDGSWLPGIQYSLCMPVPSNVRLEALLGNVGYAEPRYKAREPPRLVIHVPLGSGVPSAIGGNPIEKRLVHDEHFLASPSMPHLPLRKCLAIRVPTQGLPRA